MTVYAIRRKGDEGGLIKIGYATNLRKRLTDLRVSTPEGFDVIASIGAGQGLEKTLHRKLAEHNVVGEWFSPHPSVFEALSMASSGCFPYEDYSSPARPIIGEPTEEFSAHIVDETRFYLNELVKREWAGSGDTTKDCRDRVMAGLGIATSMGHRLWHKSQELNDVPGEVYRSIRLKYALTQEAEGTINDMQKRFLRTVRRVEEHMASSAESYEEA